MTVQFLVYLAKILVSISIVKIQVYSKCKYTLAADNWRESVTMSTPDGSACSESEGSEENRTPCFLPATTTQNINQYLFVIVVFAPKVQLYNPPEVF